MENNTLRTDNSSFQFAFLLLMIFVLFVISIIQDENKQDKNKLSFNTSEITEFSGQMINVSYAQKIKLPDGNWCWYALFNEVGKDQINARISKLEITAGTFLVVEKGLIPVQLPESKPAEEPPTEKGL